MTPRDWLATLLKPRAAERRALADARWQGLPLERRTPQQAAGRAYVACGATHGVMERCNYACTSCYLTDIANTTRPLPFAEVREQLDTLRRHLGPSGKAQITSGEVTLLSREELGKIVAYAREIGLDPMVMTNGERFVEDPAYLPELVSDHGLRKVSIHIDSTQRGRAEALKPQTEVELHPVRDRYAAMIRETRKETGKRLHAAQTVTVTPDNVDEVPAIVQWAIANCDAFRLFSFQPIAEVGRTRDERPEQMTLDAVWERIRTGAGRPLNREALHFGHPDCNIVCPMIVVDHGNGIDVIESVREDNRHDLRVMQGAIEIFGGLKNVDEGLLERGLRLAGRALSRPGYLLSLPFYGLYRLAGELRRLPRWLGAALRGRLRVRPFCIIVHQFMDADELETPLGRERLAACTFKVPIDGELVSMCEVNATGLRKELNRAAGSTSRRASAAS
ncbi:hypothetical protein ABI59_13970 [Acidobacteria bacterium Mor1]|nr:hypothetical protein ABI59_13970 [Acidobacteria bacterium Mor1]